MLLDGGEGSIGKDLGKERERELESSREGKQTAQRGTRNHMSKDLIQRGELG